MRTEQRKKTVTYNVYIASDGREFETESACRDHEKILNGTRKICPRCNGKRHINERYETYFDGGRYGDHQEHTRLEYDECPECHGKGYLEKVTEWR